jgi:hypothetical protein
MIIKKLRLAWLAEKWPRWSRSSRPYAQDLNLDQKILLKTAK